MKKTVFFIILFFITVGIFAQARFSSAKEYFDEIKNFDIQIKNYELQEETEIAIATEKLNAEKIQQQQDVEKLEKATTERQAAFEERKKNEKAKIEQVYENKIKAEQAIINSKYKALIDQEKLNKESLIKELIETEFCITAPDVVLSIGDFDVEADPMHFPITVTSKKSELNYQYKGKITLEDADIEKEANTIIAEKETYYANIYYKVVQNGSEFNKKITTILIKSPNNAVIRTIYVEDFENNKGFTVDEENAVQPTKLENEQKPLESTKEEQKNVTKAEVVKPKEPEKIRVWVDDTMADELCKGWGFTWLGIGAVFVGADYLISGEPDILSYMGYGTMGLGGVLAIIGFCIPDNYYETRYVSSIANDPVLKNVNFQTTGLTTSVSYKFSW